MAENIKTKFECSQELAKCCDDALERFGKLHDQLTKIIEAKKKIPVGASSNQDVLGAISNLEKINLRLSGAVDEIKKLGHQIQSSSQSIAEQASLILSETTNVLEAGDWGCSGFLKVSAVKLRELMVEAELLSHFGEQAQKNKNVSIDIDEAIQRRVVPSGYSQVFILLYQVDNTNLQGWYRAIKTLTDYSVTRPAYKDEVYAKEFIRSKPSGIERNGYAVVNIKSGDFYDTEKSSPIDACGHQLFVLKENSVKLENIVEFVLANKRHYAIHDNALVLLN